MATAREKNGRWYFRITISSDGKRKYIERGSFSSREEAIEAGTIYERNIKNEPEEILPQGITYGDLCEEWLTYHAPMVYKQNTIYTHKTTLNGHILPILKDYDVATIDSKMLQSIINIETAKHTRNGLSKIHSALAKTFNYGISRGYLSKNPLDGVVMPLKRSIIAKTAKPPREINCCSKELLNAIFERFPEGHPYHIPLLLGYRCGLRLGEAHGLFIEDLDRKGRKLYIRRQIQFNKETNELYLTDLKYCDPGEYRVIDLDKDTWRVLMRHINRIETNRSLMNHKQYYVNDNDIVNTVSGTPIYFMNVRLSDGSYISPRAMQYVSRVIHGKIGRIKVSDPNWDFHMLRHTHASECIAANMPPVSVQKRLGHKNLSTTYKFYIHETEDSSAEAKKVLEGMFV